MLLLVLEALACVDVEERLFFIFAAETCTGEVLLTFTQEGFGGEELVEEFHSRYLVGVGEVVEGHFDGAPFNGLEGVGEVRNGGFDAGF